MKKIELVEIRQVNDALAEMVALFRVELRPIKELHQNRTWKTDGKK